MEFKVTHPFDINLCCNFLLEKLSKMKGFERENFSKQGDLKTLSPWLNLMEIRIILTNLIHKRNDSIPLHLFPHNYN